MGKPRCSQCGKEGFYTGSMLWVKLTRKKNKGNKIGFIIGLGIPLGLLSFLLIYFG